MPRLHLCFITVVVTLVMGIPMTGHAFNVGTWKTAQTIQPFFYQKFVKDGSRVKVFSFTNPADQKTALLAGNLDICGTTLAHAVHSASMGQPVVVVALCAINARPLWWARTARYRVL